MSVSSIASFMILQLLAITTIINISFCNGITSAGCIESESQALLRFKQHLVDPSDKLASWVADRNCCKWAGVICNNVTGNVNELHLENTFCYYADISEKEFEAYQNAKLSGKISSSLLKLKHLVYLNLSGNSFDEIQIPTFLGSLRSLRYLDLSDDGFVGMVPHQLGNISHLQYLDLNQIGSGLYVKNIQWLSNLSLLKHLDLSYVNLSKASDWLSVTNSLPSLKFLGLSYCELHHSPSLSFVNFSSLATLDLSANTFENSSIPRWVFGLSNLTYLDLSWNFFEGQIPEELQNLTSLRHLDLSQIFFNFPLPNGLYQLSHLENLLLSNNSFKGTISQDFGTLTSIKNLNFSYNQIDGRIPRSFSKLCHMRTIDLRNLNLSQEISEIIDIFSTCVSISLDTIDMRGNKLFGHLIHPIGKFKRLRFLRLGDNSISGPIPSSLGELSSLIVLDLSRNKLNGTLSEVHLLNLTRLTDIDLSRNSLILKVHPNWVPQFQLAVLRLSSCNIGPKFPNWLSSQKNLGIVDLSNCKIFDTIPTWVWKYPLQFQFLDLSHNQIYGEISNLNEAALLESVDFSSNNLSGPVPLVSSNLTTLDISNNSLWGSIVHFLCNAKSGSSLRMLNLRDNSLSGEIPDCWINLQNLEILNLAHNKLSGNLPVSVGSLVFVRALHLHHNQLSGAIPFSLQNCSELQVFDISENKFAGNIPSWMGQQLTRILILNLRSNKFDGVLPKELCRLDFLQILDISYNNLSGRLPRCIGDLSAMATKDYSTDAGIFIGWTSDPLRVPYESISIVMKGEVYEYSGNLNLVRKIDLSRNNFSGTIPTEVTSLEGLQSLNLSYNSLTGKIPENIGAMGSIEEIDFSSNKLFGEIPHSISNLTSLHHLYLSNNNLVGKIPLGPQLQTLDPLSFFGNELCGAPLPKNCSVSTPENDNKEGKGKHRHENENEKLWFSVSMVFGFVVGFWGFIGPLIVNRRWRYMYCNFLDYLGYKIRDVIRKCW